MTRLLHMKGDCATRLYLDTVHTVLEHGDEYAPRGRRIREMRPAVIEFTDPSDCLVQVEGRKLNPFFHASEILWVLLGRSDTAWLDLFNTNMKTFSDDGAHFNAPYGERMRTWGKHDLTGEIHTPRDQLYSVWRLLSADADTRQATLSILDPRYDHADYIDGGGKDYPCNTALYFKIRQGALDLTVTNRSNDVHWGLFGANLPVFSTVQALMASWLGVPVGTYTQFSDSMHTYLDDYGAHLNTIALDARDGPVEKRTFDEAVPILPRTPEDSNAMLFGAEALAEKVILDDGAVQTFIEHPAKLTRFSADISKVLDDPYFEMLIRLMLAYRIHMQDAGEAPGLTAEQSRVDALLTILGDIPAGNWKRSALVFLASSTRYTHQAEGNIFKNLLDELDAVAKTTTRDIIREGTQ